MMIYDKRNDQARALVEKFEDYVIWEKSLDYMDATLREDAPEDAKNAHAEYVKLKKQIIKEDEDCPFS